MKFPSPSPLNLIKYSKYQRKRMAMLAEPKSKQKWSLDPRNINWSSDKDRYGYQMLEKMGWANGKGLGRNKSGSTSNIKIKKRKQNLGLGAQESHDNDWIAQQADFNNLLSALQKHGGNAELRSEVENSKAMLEVAKASRKRVFYKRFIRSKDTSQYSQKDMACIFGNLPSQSAPATPLNQSDDEVDSEDSVASCPTIPSDATSGFVTYTSKQNIQEYFARRMKELQDGKGIEGGKEDDKGVNCGKTEGRIEKDDSMDNQDDDMDNQGDKGICYDREGEGRSKGKKRGNSEKGAEMDSRKTKKRKKSKCVSGNDEESLVDGGRVKVKKVKKNDMLKDVVTTPNDTESTTGGKESASGGEEIFCEGNNAKVKKDKKKKKKDDEDDVNRVERISNDMRSMTEENENALYGEEANTVKVKKSKKNKRKDKLNDVTGVQMISDDVERENEKSLSSKETPSNSGGKIKNKRKKKRQMEDDVLVATDETVSCTPAVEKSTDGDSEMNEVKKEKRKKQKRKKEKKF